MNIHKHMEAILLAALGTLYAIGLTLDSLPEARAATPRPPVARSVATGGTMAVVVVRAPRLPRQP